MEKSNEKPPAMEEESKEGPKGTGITAADIEMNSEMFKAQFDPSSKTYHGGSTVPVPLGGQNIPTSMPTVLPKEETEQLVREIAAKELENHPVLLAHNTYKKLKTLLAKVAPLVEAQLRHKELYEKKKTEEGLMKMKKSCEIERNSLDALLGEIEKLFLGNKELLKPFEAEFVSFVADSRREYENRNDYFEFQTKSKKMMISANKEVQNTLNEYKKIKADFIAKQTAPKS